MMNFQEFFTKTDKRLTDAILSLWATGDKEMQDYFKFLLSQEPIMAEAVFQNTFPWEEGNLTFGQTTEIYNEHFIKALDAIRNPEYRFPLDRKPYKHQLQSWKSLLNHNKSIAVTTGTGSGKTECFMLPVIYDIYQNCRNKEGINAIFLYPLNALISSQKKRMHAWCSAIGGVNYALLTGDTPNRSNQKERDKALPQLLSREQIRATPPNILFTNPTMLEYMLVRNSDVPIIEKSQGTLRWILLDEAHTLTGSKAAEMALLIRRVVTAFKVDIKDIRFAITSATVGSGNNENLKNFMSKLCGINISQIEIIQGIRVNDQIKDEEIPSVSEVLTSDKIKKLRDDFLNATALNQKEIGEKLGIVHPADQLTAIDVLADQKISGHNLLPVRGHFFTRGIGGVYVCTNANCDKHKDEKPAKALGTMYTIAGKNCSSCSFPLLELVACRSCGNMMLEGETQRLPSGSNKLFQKVSAGYEAFIVDNEEEQDENQDQFRDSVFIIRNTPGEAHRNENLLPLSISQNNDILSSGNDFLMSLDCQCPHCGSTNNNPIHFRVSSAFTNRILSDIILDQTNETQKTTTTLYDGKKYISFTDSRQGTAKISALINIDSESNWIRYQIYHFLLKNLNQGQAEFDREELLEQRAYYIEQLDTAPPMLKTKLKADLEEVERLLSNENNLKISRATWTQILDFIKNKEGFKTLFKKAANGNNFGDESTTYGKALLFDQFARRLPRERSLENLGLVNLVYSTLDAIALPNIAEDLQITLPEWKSLLKISMDYIVRYGFHFQLDAVRNYSTKYHTSYSIYPSTSDRVNAKKWPEYNPNSITQSRLVLLICAGLGWHDRADIDREKEDLINELLQSIWTTLREKVLTSDDDGFKLNFFEKTQFELAGKEYLCPITNRLIDQVFRGYSPWIKGNHSRENIQNFRIDDNKSFQFPTFSHPFHLTTENIKLDNEQIQGWLEKNSRPAREKGLWNDLHERIFGDEKLYLAGEHSAQQSKKRLGELERQFEEGEINILSCSTTMEMGVDIGGISVVVMSNVPPMPANYLQRTGRAGRRNENKSLALTFCAPNPIGLRTINNPKWALEHEIAPPFLAFDSKNIIVRHVNSHLLGIFIRQQENEQRGLNIKENVERFFYGDQPTIAENFLRFLDMVNPQELKEELKYLVKETPLDNSSAISLISMVSDKFKKVISDLNRQIVGYDQNLEELRREFGDNSPAYKALNYRKSQLLKKFVLSYLAEVGFLPNAGLPTGIVDFEKITLSDLKNNRQDKFKTNPSYPVVRALTEFAPGNSILIDGLNYESSGIVMQSTWGQSSQRTTIQGCSNCGYQRTVEFGKINENCPHCEQTHSFRGIDLGSHRGTFTELVEPVGFAIDIFRTPTRLISDKSKPQYLEPLLLNIEPWGSQQNGHIDYRNNTLDQNAEILFYNMGDGEGYSLCFDCGRVESSNDKLEGHKRLRGGKDSDGESICSAANLRDHIILGSKFKTDFTEIRLKDASNNFVTEKSLIYSLGVIFTKTLADYLGVEEAELGFGIKSYQNYKTIFLYDTAKGGAGYASQFRFYTKEILKKALQDLENCDCSMACTKCLVDRTTQWHMEDLDRNLAVEWLRVATANQLPEIFQKNSKDVTVVIGSLYDEIHRLNYHFGITDLNIHLANNVGNWDIDNLHWLEKFKRDGIKINFIIEGDVGYNNIQEKLSIHILSHQFLLKVGNHQKFYGFPVHLSVKLNNQKSLGYILNSDYPALDPHSLVDTSKQIFKVENFHIPGYEFFRLPKMDVTNLFESRIQHLPQKSTSKDLAGIMNANLSNKDNLLSKIKNRNYRVSYFDKYNQSEFSMRLLLQFVEKLRTLWDIEIDKLDVHLERNAFKSFSYPEYIIHNYKDFIDYVYDLEKMNENFSFPIKAVDADRLPHYRFLKFESSEIKFIIRIDGGIAHGLKPVERLTSEDMSYENQIFEIRKDVPYDIIYNISLEE
ncbi:DEAD/DEAH box helicase [Vitellibacter sp. q18]|nr:DEAD/DEAH box helicase [Aequorivita lutea]